MTDGEIGMSENHMKTTRRTFLSHSAALMCCAVSPLLLSRSARALTIPDLLSGELHVVSDGHLSLPRSMQFPESLDQEKLNALLEQHDISGDTLTPDCNVTLWKTGDRTILFDVGAGPYFMPTAGKLLENLEASNIDPESITDVVLTHAHPDHLWGLLDDFDELVYPNADYYISSAEWEFWRSSDTVNKVSEARKPFVIGAQNRFGFIEDRIKLFKPGQEILPGVEAFDTSGHTPGHTAFVLHDNGSSVVLVGDALTNVAVSFEYPKWPSGSDQDPEQGVKTRMQLLDRLAQEKLPIIGFHLPHPGVGYVEADGSRYQFVS